MKVHLKHWARYRFAMAAGAILAVVAGAYFALGETAPAYNTLTVATGDFSESVTVTGKVVPAQEVDLGFTSGGRIASVNVRVGSRVSRGAVLATIDSGDLRATIAQREAAVDTQKAKLSALLQGTRSEEVAIAESQVQSDTSNLVQAEETLRDAIRDAYVVADDAVRNKVHESFSNPSVTPRLNYTSTNSQFVIDVEAQVAQVENMLNAWQKALAQLPETDVTAALSDARRNMIQVSRLLADMSTVLKGASANAYVMQASINAFASNIATARASVSASQASLTSADSKRKAALSALESSNRALTLKKAGTTQSDIDAQVAVIRSAEGDLANARAQISKTVIQAPFAGIITTLDAKAGAIASPNTPLISMISGNTFQIESFVPEVSIAQVKVGDAAKVALDAYGAETIFTAKVVSIAPAETVKNGVSNYKTTLEFAKPDPRIRSGMTANVTITTRMLPETIAVPRGAVFERGGSQYVRIKQDEIIIERQVKTGAESQIGNVEILTGLEAGDTIVLDPLE